MVVPLTDRNLTRTVLAAIDDAVMVINPDRRIDLASPALLRELRYRSTSLIGAAVETLEAEASEGDHDLLAALDAARDGPWAGRIALLAGDGQTLSAECNVYLVEGRGGEVSAILVLDRQAMAPAMGLDPVTNLPNRELFQDRLEQAIAASIRNRYPIALMLVGIDRFNLVTTGLGRDAANMLLADLGRRLKGCVRDSDSVSHFDRDVFALALALTNHDDALVVAQKVHTVVGAPFLLNDQETAVTVSIGVAISPSDGRDAATLIAHSEEALDFARAGGRRAVEFFAGEMNERARRRLEMETALRTAVDGRQFVAHYQPKFDVETGRIFGMETLIRWNHPQRGLIPPGEFLPIAEQTGLIVEIGAWTLKETCRQAKAWQDIGLPAIKASVNISARQFGARDLVSTVEEALDETGLAPEYLELEMTESILSGDSDITLVRLSALRDLGIDLAIDDFGTGYSSVSYLTRFPITTLKVDRAFVRDVESNPRTAEIARAIMSLSQGLDLRIVAEGAETAAHVEFLRAHGCKLVQGYFYARPLPAAEFEALLRSGGLPRTNSE